ncbi:hypothetical protein GGI13_000483 [Coemansia sp. RSA 455]|nr:hypothetical protein H4S03_007625 [Coemansia sp. S3946]KAJ2042609.1 hypothetical protein H4S04_007207 [Coemansia sp. S16]KAJ2060716.1 hypothetical protein GGI08_002994 [Coemansia sp. S2]KAJ2068846.1 hypothetical protein GGH13_004755 [Coemansia sp. S155-1]KAJ2100461.1 hypothetical protein GGI09_002273 [Coemansia sp. S100]KAJ2258756.1 hypothetical protein GGI13_000483 [Coemansia sp. RSA 455]KAJ2351112.1 hypothetical protein GGH92_002003 [Coemansia sp. RSA 2673]
MTNAVPEVSQVPEAKKDKAKLNKYEYEFRVAMSCSGCSGTFTRALTNYNGGKIEVIAKTGKPILEIIEKPKVREVVAKQALGLSPAA